jgi:hypothetical protein
MLSSSASGEPLVGLDVVEHHRVVVDPLQRLPGEQRLINDPLGPPAPPKTEISQRMTTPRRRRSGWDDPAPR